MTVWGPLTAEGPSCGRRDSRALVKALIVASFLDHPVDCAELSIRWRPYSPRGFAEVAVLRRPYRQQHHCSQLPQPHRTRKKTRLLIDGRMKS